MLCRVKEEEERVFHNSQLGFPTNLKPTGSPGRVFSKCLLPESEREQERPEPGVSTPHLGGGRTPDTDPKTSVTEPENFDRGRTRGSEGAGVTRK